MTLWWSLRGDITGLDCDSQQAIRGERSTSPTAQTVNLTVWETEIQRGAE